VSKARYQKNCGKTGINNHSFFCKKLNKKSFMKKAESLLTLPYWRTGRCDMIWISQVFEWFDFADKLETSKS
jgi:hypothetical protein